MAHCAETEHGSHLCSKSETSLTEPVQVHLRTLAHDKPSSYVRRFLYDTVVYTPRNLRFLIDVVGADRVVFGTDWPAPMTFDDPVGRLERMVELSDEERHALLRGTAASVFGASVVGA